MRSFSSGDYLRALMEELDRAGICRRIAKARDQAGLTQPELGEALEPSVHWRTIQVWERGENMKDGTHRWTVPWKKLGQIAEITGTTKEWLIHGQVAEPAGEMAAQLDRIERGLAELVARLEPDEPEGPGESEPQ